MKHSEDGFLRVHRCPNKHFISQLLEVRFSAAHFAILLVIFRFAGLASSFIEPHPKCIICLLFLSMQIYASHGFRLENLANVWVQQTFLQNPEGWDIFGGVQLQLKQAR